MAAQSLDDLVSLVINQGEHGKNGDVGPDNHTGENARGIMQVLPSTGKEVADQLGVPFDVNRLQNDPEYNKMIGTEYLRQLQTRYKDMALTLAAYNAGPGNVDHWIKNFGDPRDGKISYDEWAQRIAPETAGYLRRTGYVGMASVPNYVAPTTGNMVDTSTWVLPSDLIGGQSTPNMRNPLAPGQAEMLSQSQPSIANPQPQNSINLLGGQTDYQSAKDTEEGLNLPVWDAITRTFRSTNSVIGAWDWAERQTIPADPNFNWEAGREEFQKQFPMEYWSRYNSVNSKTESDLLTWELQRELDDRALLSHVGTGAAAASLVTGFADIDTAMAILSGGTSEAISGAIKAGRLAKITRGAWDGLKSGAVVNGANAYFRPSGSVHEAVAGTLLNSLIGGAAGTFGKLEREANARTYDTMQDYNDFRYGGEDARADYGEFNYGRPHSRDDLMGSTAMAGDSGGAARYNDPNRPITNSAWHGVAKDLGLSEDQISQIDQAQIWRETSGWNDAKAKAFEANPRFQRLVEAWNKVPFFKSDWESLGNSRSAVLNKIAYDLMENPLGYLVNNRSAALLQHHYLKSILHEAQQPIEDMYQAWARAQGLGWKDRNWNDAARRDFGKQMIGELYRRRMGDPNVTVPKEVVQAADAWQKAMDRAFTINKGAAGEHAVRGFDGVQWKEGYVPLIWKGIEIDRAIERLGYKDVANSFADAYMDAHPGLTSQEAREVADAVISVARSKQNEVDMNLMGLLAGDGRVYLQRELEKKIGAQQANLIINRLSGTLEERGTTARAKGRMEIDIRKKLSDGTQLMDLTENDPQRLLHQYSRQTAGQAALARHGYTNKAAVSDAINLALEEQRALKINPGDKGYVSREQLETIFSYFGGGTVGQGVHPTVRMMQQVTNLALLNQLGLQQLAESATTMAAVGWKEWIKYAPQALKDAFTGNKSAMFNLANELSPIMGGIGDIHNVYRSDLIFDTIQRNPAFTTQWMDTMEKALNKASRIQGFTTGFYQIQAAQHRMVIELMAQKVMKDLRSVPGAIGQGTQGIHLAPDLERRLAEIGISGRFLQRLKKNIDAHVQWRPDGTVEKLNVDKWDFRTQEDFALAMNRAAGMQVQHTFAGEGSYRMSNTFGAMMTHLKSFPLIAIKKQFGRNARLMDTQTKMLFLYGMGLGSAMYALKQGLNGNTQNLDPISVAKGGFGMSNLTGWIPMFTDPVATMLGMDSLRFNEYGARGVDSGIISPPPMYKVGNTLLHLPGAALDFAVGSPTSSDYAALKVLPLVGNYYGVAGLINAMREDTKGAKLDPAIRDEIKKNNDQARAARQQARLTESRNRLARDQQRLTAANSGQLPENHRKELKKLEDQPTD